MASSPPSEPRRAREGKTRPDVADLGRSMLRDLFGEVDKTEENEKSLAEEIERELGLLPDGAAALGQWRRARIAAAAAPAATTTTTAAQALLPPARLLQELAHDRLHTGHWSAAPPAWRAAHAAATLAAVGSRLAMEEGGGGGAGGSSSASSPSWPPALAEFLLDGDGSDGKGDQTQEQLLLTAALRALDVAIILGAPNSRLRAALDAAAERADAALAAHEDDEDGSAGVKRRRREAEVQQAAAPPPQPRLPPRSLSPCSSARLASSPRPPPLDAFFARHMLPRRPLLIRAGLMDGWPALSRWRDVDYLHSAVGRRTVPVEAGEHFLDAGLATLLLPFGVFLQRAVQQRGEEGGGGPQRLYLAQHPLLDQLPRLRRDVLVPDYCALAVAEGEEGDKGEGEGEGDDEPPARDSAVAINAWLSGPGAVTPLHHDGTRHNLLCVVAGRKYVRLYPPGLRTEAALRPLPAPHSNASALVPADLVSSPLPAADAKALALLDDEAMVDAMVGPGQALYIPPGWWHYVSSWAEEEEEGGEEDEERGGRGVDGAAAPPAPRHCFAVSFWW
jgi:lysine-specific demethylase 8